MTLKSKTPVPVRRAQRRVERCRLVAVVEKVPVGWDRLLRKEIGRMSSSGFVKMKRAAALLFCSVHSRISMLQ